MRRFLPLLAVLGLLQAAGVSAQQPVDLNNATQDELEALPGIGEKMAQDIIDNRPFSKVEDLLSIPRFGRKRFDKLKDLVMVGEPGQAGAADEGSPAAGSRSTSSASPSTWKTPDGMETMQCWRCQERFCVEKGTEAGVCPYCGVRWGRKGASP